MLKRQSSISIAATPLSSLNRRFRKLADKQRAMDELETALPDGPSRDAVWAEQGALLDQSLALQDAAAGLPARTLEDAAIQALFAYYRVERLTVDEGDQPDISAIMTSLASIVLALGRIGAFDIDQIGWGGARHLRAFRALAGSAAA
jgi:hypothetical protein